MLFKWRFVGIHDMLSLTASDVNNQERFIKDALAACPRLMSLLFYYAKSEGCGSATASFFSPSFFSTSPIRFVRFTPKYMAIGQATSTEE